MKLASSMWAPRSSEDPDSPRDPTSSGEFILSLFDPLGRDISPGEISRHSEPQRIGRFIVRKVHPPNLAGTDSIRALEPKTEKDIAMMNLDAIEVISLSEDV